MLSVNIISLKNGEVMEGKPCFTWGAGGFPLTVNLRKGVERWVEQT